MFMLKIIIKNRLLKNKYQILGTTLQKKYFYPNVTTILPGRNGLVGSPNGTGWGNIPDFEELDSPGQSIPIEHNW